MMRQPVGLKGSLFFNLLVILGLAGLSWLLVIGVYLILVSIINLLEGKVS